MANSVTLRLKKVEAALNTLKSVDDLDSLSDKEVRDAIDVIVDHNKFMDDASKYVSKFQKDIDDEMTYPKSSKAVRDFITSFRSRNKNVIKSEGYKFMDRVVIEEEKDEGEQLSTGQIISRQDVISAMERKVSFVTAYQKDGRWRKGDNVEVVIINHTQFIRTGGDRIEEDNLGELPEF